VSERYLTVNFEDVWVKGLVHGDYAFELLFSVGTSPTLYIIELAVVFEWSMPFGEQPLVLPLTRKR